MGNKLNKLSSVHMHPLTASGSWLACARPCSRAGTSMCRACRAAWGGQRCGSKLVGHSLVVLGPSGAVPTAVLEKFFFEKALNVKC